VSLVRCKNHGRFYDDAKAAGCPLCLQDENLPRAPGGRAAEPAPEPARTSFGLVLLGLVLAIAVGGFAIYKYKETHNDQTRAAAARDSLRQAGADLGGPALGDTSKLAANNDLGPIRRARALRASLESMLARSRGSILGLATGPVDTTAGNRKAQRHAKQVAAFIKHWGDQLDHLTSGGTDFRYAPGVRFGSQMDNVTNQLKAAVSVMRDMVRPVTKPRAERSTDIRDATGYLNSAGSVLSGLPR
jgi:hypothetical protein